ncbi:adenylate kinase family protein [Halospeciosus flavus]|uniref:Putative adenylate kinase n=1 Tax=Halospeciosus flavus TaxID=3032283 RepID=A0ABD5Z2W4_9EURY|nr:adenylate kinase family protein [Halospeciosus flavus]
MKVAVTGTPGTGKTTATDLLDTDLEVIHLNEIVEEEELYSEVDEERDSLVVDLEAVEEWLEGKDDFVLDSHLAHLVEDLDKVVVLRCRPRALEERLRESGVPGPKAHENAESEALDIILSEAVERHGEENVYEIDTTDRTPEEVATEIERVLAGEREPSAGEVDFTDFL